MTILTATYKYKSNLYTFMCLMMFIGCLNAASANAHNKPLNFLIGKETNSTINSTKLLIVLEKKEIGKPIKAPMLTSSAVPVDTRLIANVGSYAEGGSTITDTKWKAVLFTTGSVANNVGSVNLVLTPFDVNNPATVGVRIAIFSVNSGVLGSKLAGSAVSTLNLTSTTSTTLTLQNSFTLAPNTSYALVVQSDSSTGFKWANIAPDQEPTAYQGYTYDTMKITTDTGTNWSVPLSYYNAFTFSLAPPPTISNFNNLNKMYHDGSYSIIAPASNSTGAFSYISSNTAVATISGTTVTILSAGTSTITANQAADASYNTASIEALLTVGSEEVLLINGGTSHNNPNYIDSNGKKGGSTGLNQYGKIKTVKTQ